MKRVWIAVMLLIACLAVGSTGVATAKKHKHKPKHITTSISLTVQNTPATTYSPGSVTYSGQVSAGGPSGCRSGRIVTISRNGAPVATTTTSSSGGYSVSAGSAAAGGTYTASVPSKKVVKKGKKGKKGKKRKKKKFICSAATSPPVTVS